MARLPRLVVPNQLHHVLARGNNGQPVFLDDTDYQQFMNLLRDTAQQYGVAIHAYVLLPNRVQLMATPSTEPALGKMMQAIGRQYVPWFNARHQRSGSLWEGRFRATVMDADDYFVPCAHLIEYQPLHDAVSMDMEHYRWSSHAHHTGARRQAWLTDHPAYWKLGNTPFEREAVYKQLCATPPASKVVEAIDDATRKAWALGSDAFRASLAKLTGRRLEPARRGRPRKTVSDAGPVKSGSISGTAAAPRSGKGAGVATAGRASRKSG